MFYKLINYEMAGEGTYSTTEIAYLGAASNSYSLQIRLRTIQKEYSPSWFIRMESSIYGSWFKREESNKHVL